MLNGPERPRTYQSYTSKREDRSHVTWSKTGRAAIFLGSIGPFFYSLKMFKFLGSERQRFILITPKLEEKKSYIFVYIILVIHWLFFSSFLSSSKQIDLFINVKNNCIIIICMCSLFVQSYDGNDFHFKIFY
jgi:hypothetical protein